MTPRRAALDAIRQGLALIGIGLAYLLCGRPTYTNCILWALWRLRSTPGSVVVLRPSDYGWWLHAWFAPEGVTGPLEEYNPLVAKSHRQMPPPLFVGRVQTATSTHPDLVDP